MDQSHISLYAALHSAAGLIDLGSRTQLEIAGEDRVGFLNGFCTGDVKKLQPGEGCEAFITNHQGKAAGHGLIFVHEDRLIFDGAAGQAEKLIAHLDRFVISEKVFFADRSPAATDLLLAGPDAERMLQAVTGAIPAGRLHHVAMELPDLTASLRRVDFLHTVPCFLISLPTEQVALLKQALTIVGAIQVEDEANDAAWQMARIEAGYPLYGQDITEDNLPQEVARDAQAINFNKGCYLGQETIARLDALGHVNRVLTGLKFLGGANLQPGETILQGEKKIAQITSVAWSPKLQAPLALAYVRTLHATPGKRLAFAGGEAEVVKLPLASEKSSAAL